MPKGYNSLNDIKTNPYEIGICPICSVRLTHGCEHSQSQLAQEWLAAVIVAEQDGYLAGYDPAPLTPATGSTMKKTIHMTDDTRGVYDTTPRPSDMPEIDFDGVDEIEF